MVANLTVGKPKFAEFEELNQSAIVEGNILRATLVDLIDRDTEAYGKLSAAFKLPRETDEDKAFRSATIAAATIGATETPFEMMEVAFKALILCRSLIGKSNANAASDLGVSALNLLACVKGAWLNVLINLNGIKDVAKAEHFKIRGQELVDLSQKEADYIYEIVKSGGEMSTP
jgi:formiminotetrahydrofolate cyclodeaminase